MHLYDYVNDIWDIAHANNVDVGVGKDMFIANIRNAGDPTLPHYAGADNVDYAGLQAYLPELIESGEEYDKIVSANYTEIVAARAEGNRDLVFTFGLPEEETSTDEAEDEPATETPVEE